MTVTGDLPRDDRAWPRWAGAFSVLAGLVALAVGVGAVATASDGEVAAPWVAGGLVTGLVVGVIAFRRGFLRLLAGHRPSAGSQLLQLGLVLLGFLTMGYDARLGLAVMAGLFAALFGTNLWAIRRARDNRGAVDAADAALERERRDRPDPPRPAATAPAVAGEEPEVDVAAALDSAWSGSRRRWLGWLLATVVVTAGTNLLTESGLARFMVPFMGGAVLLWVGLSLGWLWLARRDFSAADTRPQRAFVVLLDDPTPRTIRPLLGVWTEQPVARSGSFPKPELVFRCDDSLDDLLSHQGSAVVHEAWVDTSSHGMRGARWVAADEGIAVPHHRGVLFGRWYFHALTRAERPDAPTPLRTPAPHPESSRTVPVTHTEVGRSGLAALGRAVAWRGAALAALAVGSVLVD